MYLTFKNNSTGSVMTVIFDNRRYSIKPESTVEVPYFGGKIEFTAETSALNELVDAVNEIDDKDKSAGLKDRILTKLAKKAAQKLPDTVLDTSVRYEVNCENTIDVVIDLYDGACSMFDGKLADFLEIIPIAYLFVRAEVSCGVIKAISAKTVNRKKFLKLVRFLLLFTGIGLASLNLLFFIPEYLVIKLFASDFYVSRMLSGLYGKSPSERENYLLEKERRFGQDEKKKKGCFSSLVKLLIVIFIAVALFVVIFSSGEPDVIISEDFGTVMCFDETFIKIDTGLPSDAKDVFLEDYWAFYPLPDGEYDGDNYYCYIYETPDGTRYMWLKDNCSDKENKSKKYEDYENPLVYKSLGDPTAQY